MFVVILHVLLGWFLVVMSAEASQTLVTEIDSNRVHFHVNDIYSEIEFLLF